MISVCVGETYEIELTGTVGASVTTNIPAYGTVVLPATIELVASADVTYSYSSITINDGTPQECVFTLTDSTTVDVTTLPTATLVAPNGGSFSCSSDSPVVTITSGTAQATVGYTIDGVAGTVVLDSFGNGSIAMPATEGTHVVVRTSVTRGTCSNTTTQTINVPINVDPVMSIWGNSYECSEDLLYYEVQFTSSHSLLSATEGSITNIGSGLYLLSDVPSGTPSTITATNGVCTTTLTTSAYTCDCSSIVVDPPTSLGDQSMCENDLVIPTLSVFSAEEVDWYDSPTGGSLVQNDSLTYTPTSAVTANYYAQAVTTAGCTSTRTLVRLNVNPNPNVDPIINYQDLCEGDTVTFAPANVIAVAPTYSWAADFDDCVGCAIVGLTTNPSVQVDLGGSVGDTFTLTLTVTDTHYTPNCESEETYYGTIADCTSCSGTPCDEQSIAIPASDTGYREWELEDGLGFACTVGHFGVSNCSNMTVRTAALDLLCETIKEKLAECYPSCASESSWDDFTVTYEDNCPIDAGFTITFTDCPITFETVTTLGGTYNFTECGGGGTGGTGGTA